MSVSKDRNLGAGLIAATVLVTALGNWDTVINHLPKGARPYAESPLTAIILALAGVWFLWRAAGAAEGMERQAAEAHRLATETNAALQRRVEEAEAKLDRAIDQQILDWSPALEQLFSEGQQRIFALRTELAEEMQDDLTRYQRELRRETELFHQNKESQMRELEEAMVTARSMVESIKDHHPGGG